MTDVRIYHPALDRYVAVPESAVSIHRNAGWILADEVGTEAAAVDSGSAGTQANGLAVPPEETTAKTTSARGRRQDKEQ
jgi:hypothetical protein